MENKEIITLNSVIHDTVENIGFAFTTGCLAGGCYYLATGMMYHPKGKRLMGALKHARDRTTLFGGSIAMWSALFNGSRGGLAFLRQKDDKWNPTFGGFFAGFMAHARGSMSLGIS